MRFLHTSITVTDLDRSIKFYQEALDLKLKSRREIPENNAEIAFLESPGSNASLELTYWRGKRDYAEGDQLDHLAFSVSNMEEAMEKLRGMGVTIAKEPYSLQGSSRKIAFIRDPDGIWIELMETA